MKILKGLGDKRAMDKRMNIKGIPIFNSLLRISGYMKMEIALSAVRQTLNTFYLDL